MADVSALINALHKKHGKRIGGMGATYEQVKRRPTGIFAFDLASGGGFPRNRVSIIYGPESSGKTNLAFCAIRESQKSDPDKVAVFIEFEPVDYEWAKRLGVDIERVAFIRPSTAEQGIDIVEGMIQTNNCSIVVVDSLAFMVTAKQQDADAASGSYGGNSFAIATLVRKVGSSMGAAEKAGLDPTVIYINQTRANVGVMYGDPEKMPGGNGPKFQSALTVRQGAKNVIVKSVSDVMPVAKETNLVIKKWKVPIVAAAAQYTMATIPHDGLTPGHAEDSNTLLGFLQEYHLLAKGNKPAQWFYDGAQFSSKKAVKEYIYADPAREAKTKADVIAMAVEKVQKGEFKIEAPNEADAETGEILDDE